MIMLLPVILVLGATIVPLLLWSFAAGRRHRDTDDMKPERPPTAAPGSRAQPEEPEGSLPHRALLQIRPDGVVLDWRDESSMASRLRTGLPVTAATDSTALR